MLEELSEKHTRIAEFLNSGEWFIGEGREQTRRALAECLALVPDPLVDYVFDARRLMVIAPRCNTCETVSIREHHDKPASETHFVVVCLDFALERTSYPEARSAVARILGEALNLLIGRSHELSVYLSRPDSAGEQPN
jgi:hypothetical protein